MTVAFMNAIINRASGRVERGLDGVGIISYARVVRVVHRLAVVVMLLAAIQLVGLPWAALLAASKAAQTYRTARQQGVLAALKSVPKGKGTCGTCKKIRLAKAKADQRREPLSTGLQWMPAVLPPGATTMPVHRPARHAPAAVACWMARAESPPIPPPRLS
jgi:hypothetical protein